MIPECTNVSRCFDQTKCVYNKQLGYNTCACDILYDPYQFCNKTIFSSYKGGDLYYVGIGMAFYSILFLLYLFEFSIDINRKKYTPVLYTKAVMMAFILVRLAYLSIWIISSVNETASYKKYAFVIESIGSLMLVASNMLIIVSWLDLILMAKNIGNRAQKMKVIKRILFVGILGIIPVMIVAVVLSQVIKGLLILAQVSAVALMFLIISTIIISIICLVIIIKWINSDKDSKIKNKMKRKSIWIITCLVCLIGLVFITIISFVALSSGPQIYLGLEITKRIVEILMSTFMFFFLENAFVSVVKKGKFSLTTERTGQSEQSNKSGKSNRSDKTTSSTRSGDPMNSSYSQ
jgi:hypothetical protein